MGAPGDVVGVGVDAGVAVEGGVRPPRDRGRPNRDLSRDPVKAGEASYQDLPLESFPFEELGLGWGTSEGFGWSRSLGVSKTSTPLTLGLSSFSRPDQVSVSCSIVV